MNYLVLASNSLEQLADAVSEYVQRGWVPTGGIAVVHHTNNGDTQRLHYLQAIYVVPRA